MLRLQVSIWTKLWGIDQPGPLKFYPLDFSWKFKSKDSVVQKIDMMVRFQWEKSINAIVTKILSSLVRQL
jgi:hypothetical protein